MDSSAPFRLMRAENKCSEAKQKNIWPYCINLTLKLMLNKWGVKTQTALISFLPWAIHFFFVLLVGCLFVSIFANFSRLYWPTMLARHQVFLLIVCTTLVTILRIFFESDKYLCPLTVSFKFPSPRDKHVPFEAKIFPTPEEFETGPPFSFFNSAPINVKLARGRGMGWYF